MLSKEQLAFRKTGIGGSDAPGILGLSKYSNAVDVYLSKVQDKVADINENMERGNILEPFIKSLFQLKTGFSFNKVDNFRSDQHNFMIANLDGFCNAERAVIELKSADYSVKSEWGEEWSDEIPKEYLIQVAHYCTVMEVKKAYIGVLFGNKKLFESYKFIQNQINKGFDMNLSDLECDFKVYIYSEEPRLQNKIIEKEKHFWFENVEKGILPVLEHYTCDDLLKIYPQENGQKRLISKEGLIELEKLNNLKNLKKEIKVQEELVKSNIFKLFENSSILIDEEGSSLATWKSRTRNFIDSYGLQKEYPHIYERFLKPSTNRVLTTTKDDNNDQ